MIDVCFVFQYLLTEIIVTIGNFLVKGASWSPLCLIFIITTSIIYTEMATTVLSRSLTH